MILKSLKWGLVATSGAILLGGLIFGGDLVSYVSCGASSVRSAVKDKVPIEFQLERARQMIDEILPELHANVEIIAREQVEVEHLRKEIYQAADNVSAQRYQVGLLRDRLTTQQVSTYQVGSRTISRQQVVERLASRLDRFKQAKTILTSKQRMLDVRDQALAAAEEMLDKTKIRKAQLEEKIEALVAQHRLVKAQAVASEVHIDNSKLARADRLMTEIQKRLETAQRVLAHEADFFADDVVEVFSEDELLAEVDAQLENGEFDVLAVLQDADELK